MPFFAEISGISLIGGIKFLAKWKKMAIAQEKTLLIRPGWWHSDPYGSHLSSVRAQMFTTKKISDLRDRIFILCVSIRAS
ncbi:MAG: hypothetical protein SFX18_11105 [Pirellulales bacterium]|nr:hypothetical protein [Pirellulales bacterium]